VGEDEASHREVLDVLGELIDSWEGARASAKHGRPARQPRQT
jgi:hypothetical protein